MRDEAFRFMRDTFYVTVGFGVLSVQKLQVRRRELEKTIERTLSGPRQQVGRVIGHNTSGNGSAAPISD